MLVGKTSIFSTEKTYCFLLNKRNDKIIFRPVFAKNRDFPSPTNPKKKNNIFPLKLSKPLLAKSIASVFCLGFIDAGYSGDWSRIGVISKQNEEFLKVAAFLVVPLCLFLVFSFFDKEKPQI